MKRRVLILEDLEVTRKALVQMVQECSSDLEIYDFAEMGAAMTCAMEHNIDLFLIDVILKPFDINDFSGITFAKTLRDMEQYKAAEIVFVTTLAGLEAEMLRLVHCFDYIEKPISEERVKKVIGEVLDKLNGRNTKRELIFLRKEKITYPVYEDQIVYVESQKRVLYIHTPDEVIEIPNLSLKQLLERVKSQEFIPTARGLAINVEYIHYVDFTNRYVKMRHTEDLIDIGPRLKKGFEETLRKYERQEERGDED